LEENISKLRAKVNAVMIVGGDIITLIPLGEGEIARNDFAMDAQYNTLILQIQ